MEELGKTSSTFIVTSYFQTDNPPRYILVAQIWSNLGDRQIEFQLSKHFVLFIPRLIPRLYFNEYITNEN